MDEEVSWSLHMSLIVWMTGALLAVVCGVLVMSLKLLNQQSDQYSTTVVSASVATIGDLAGHTASGALCYARIMDSSNSIEGVYYASESVASRVTDYSSFKNNKSSLTQVYDFKSSTEEELNKLMSIYKNNNYKVYVIDGSINSMYIVILVEE